MTDRQKLTLIAILAFIAFLIYLLAPVLTPFAIAATLAYMGDPLVDRFERKLSRGLSVSVVFLLIAFLILILLFGLIPLLENQLGVFVKKLPVYLDRLQTTALPWITAQLGFESVGFDLTHVQTMIKEHWMQAGGIAARVMASISKSGMMFFAWMANILLIPVLTFYLLRDWDILVARIHELVPRRLEPTVAKIAKESDAVLGSFMRGQIVVMASLGATYSIGLWIVGVDFSLLIGMLAGVVSFVPYLGFLVGIVVAGITAALQFQDAMILFYVAIVFGVGQLAESFVLTPLLLGDKIGLHPVAVVFAVMAGGQLFGFVGILLALPVAAVIMVVLRNAHEHYVKSNLYKPK